MWKLKYSASPAIAKLQRAAYEAVMNAETERIAAWRRAALAELDKRDLTGVELQREKLRITSEVGRQANRAEGRAQRAASARKVIEP